MPTIVMFLEPPVQICWIEMVAIQPPLVSSITVSPSMWFLSFLLYSCDDVSHAIFWNWNLGALELLGALAELKMSHLSGLDSTWILYLCKRKISGTKGQEPSKINVLSFLPGKNGECLAKPRRCPHYSCPLSKDENLLLFAWSRLWELAQFTQTLRGMAEDTPATCSQDCVSPSRWSVKSGEMFWLLFSFRSGSVDSGDKSQFSWCLGNRFNNDTQAQPLQTHGI